MQKPPFPRPPVFAAYFAKGYEGQGSYDRPSGPTQWLFQGPPAESKVLAVGESGVLFADFTLGNFSGSVDKMIVIWLDDDPHDAPSLKLTVRVHVPVLVAVEPKTLNWKLGGQASPQTIRVTIKDARPTHVTSVTCTNQSSIGTSPD